MGEAEALVGIGTSCVLTDQLQEVDAFLDDAERIFDEISDSCGLLDVHMRRAFLLQKHKREDEAIEAMGRCVSLCQKVGHNGAAARWIIFWSDHLKSKGLSEDSKMFLEHARVLADNAKDPVLKREITDRLTG